MKGEREMKVRIRMRNVKERIEIIEKTERCGWGPPTLPTPHILLVIVILLSRFLVEVLPEQFLYIIISRWSHIRDIAFKVHLINVNTIGTKILT